MAIYNLTKAAAVAILSTLLQHEGSREPRKLSSKTDKLLECEMIGDPSLNAVILKKEARRAFLTLVEQL